MSAFNNDTDRRLVPRWRDFATTLSVGEVQSLSESKDVSPIDEESLQEKRLLWEKEPGLGSAADYVQSSFVAGGSREAIEAARYVASRTEHTEGILHRIALEYLNEQKDVLADEESYVAPSNRRDSTIVRLKRHLISQPRDAIARVDLALRYMSHNQADKAVSQILIALSVAKDNRFVVRSAARCFLHIGDLQRAQDVVRQAESVRIDPWLLATEVALSSVAGKTSRLLKIAQSMAEDANIHPFHLTELQGALATMEGVAGSRKKSQRLFRRSLHFPNDNALAQAEWASRHLVTLDVQDSIQKDVPRKYEAVASARTEQGQWSDALECSIRWMNDELYSSRPPGLASYIACVGLEDYGKAVEICRLGLKANPDDFGLLNNLALSFAHVGSVGEAQTTLARVNASELDTRKEIVFIATMGLVAMRSGQIEVGRSHYQRAISLASKRGLDRLEYRARFALAREELQLPEADRSALASQLEVFAETIDDAGLRSQLERLVGNSEEPT